LWCAKNRNVGVLSDYSQCLYKAIDELAAAQKTKGALLHLPLALLSHYVPTT